MYYTTKEVYEFISKQANDPIVEWKTCEISEEVFPIYQSDLEFYSKVSPTFEVDQEYAKQFVDSKPEYFSYKDGKLKIKVPTPKLCPEERQRRRLLFRNERKLYKRKCDATGENIISIYSPDKNITVYNQDFWWSDNWDPMKYWIIFDNSYSIQGNLKQLLLKFPHISLITIAAENSDYCNYCWKMKNCYLCFASESSSECFFSTSILNAENCYDSIECFVWKHNYQTISCSNSFKVFFSIRSESCSDSYFLHNCAWCSNCFWCTNLKNKQYCIFNKQYTQEEYFYKLDKLLSDSYHKGWNYFLEKTQDTIDISCYNIKVTDCFWNMINNSQSCSFCYIVDGINNSKYSINWASNSSDMYDMFWFGLNSDLLYDWIDIWENSYFNLFSTTIRNSKYLYYSMNCNWSSNLFGCIGLRNKEYCIFNKQYTKEEYNKLVPKIISKMIDDGEWGEFFHPSLSPFGYNETVAMEYYPLTKQEALDRWYHRQDNNYDPIIPDGVKTLKWDDIPSDISQVSDDILKQIFICEVSDRPFRVIKQELAFYRKHNLPLPRKHPDVRHQERLNQRAPRELHLRNCDKCWIDMLSVYKKDNSRPLSPSDSSPNRGAFIGKIYCEKCYNKEVYW